MSQFLLLVGGVSNPFHQLPTIPALFGECNPGSGPRSKEVFEPKFSGNISQHILWMIWIKRAVQAIRTLKLVFICLLRRSEKGRSILLKLEQVSLLKNLLFVPWELGEFIFNQRRGKFYFWSDLKVCVWEWGGGEDEERKGNWPNYERKLKSGTLWCAKKEVTSFLKCKV